MGVVIFLIICRKYSWSVGVGDKCISLAFVYVCVCVNVSHRAVWELLT